MRVKIGDTWYDSKDQPLAVQFGEAELELAKQMPPDGNRTFGAGSGDGDELLAWMREGRDTAV